MSTTETISRASALGQVWPEQGGVYIGKRLIDGVAHHIIVADGIESDIEKVEFKNVDKAVADAGEINGHADWRAPEQEDLMLAYINAPEQFVREGVLIFKWNEIQIPTRQILELTPNKPLFGHPSGKRADTHWITFMKGRS